MINNCIFRILWNGWLGKLWRKKTFVKIIIYKKWYPRFFLMYKASNIKMFSWLSSRSQYYTFISPWLIRELWAVLWRNKPMILLLVFSWAQHRSNRDFITDKAVTAMRIKYSLLNYTCRKKSQSATFSLIFKVFWVF